jgi:hypothetical protein
MYYSYVEIEYVATSFSPARTDLALKLLTRKIYMDYIKDPCNKETTMKYLKETLPQNKVPSCKSTIQRSLPPYGISYKNLLYDVGTLEKQVRNIDVRHLNASSLCQDWFIACHQSSRMSPLTIFLVKMKK